MCLGDMKQRRDGELQPRKRRVLYYLCQYPRGVNSLALRGGNTVWAYRGATDSSRLYTVTRNGFPYDTLFRGLSMSESFLPIHRLLDKLEGY